MSELAKCFLNDLNDELSFLPYDIADEIIERFQNDINSRTLNGESEEKIIYGYGEISDIVRKEVNSTSLFDIIDFVIKRKFSKFENKKRATLLSVLSSPIWFPILIIVAFAYFCFNIVVLLFYLIPCILYFGIFFVGFVSILLGIIRGFLVNPLTGVVYFGVGLFFMGLIIMSYKSILNIYEKWILLNFLPLEKLKLFLIRKGIK